MKRVLIGLCVGLFVCRVAAAAPDSGCNPNLGGAAIAVPSPGEKYVEIGSDKHNYLVTMVPESNHLLCAFLTRDDTDRLTKPPEIENEYFLVEVSKDLESHDSSSSDFDDTVAAVKQYLGDADAMQRSFKDVEAQANTKLKEIGSAEQIALGKPTQLGTLFQIKDAYGFAIITPLASGSNSVNVLFASVLVRVNNRLVYLYTYTVYKDASSFKWIGEITEGWARMTLAMNTR